MTSLVVPSIFCVTLAAVVVILSLATMIGRAWSDFLPFVFRPHARFYLAPALGLATLVIVASLIGRVLALGNSIVVPTLVIGFLGWLVIREHSKYSVFRHVLTVSVFGIVCGVSVLAPLFVYGAFNAHNDAFTYLTHSDWLQLHPFRENISAETVTPLTTQVALYQQGGFRMGGSFLLAFSQALLNLHWSYEVYPAVIISAITVCCLAIGFPLARVLCPMRSYIRLALLALPAFSLGGLVFGANLGFLPQTIGLALGSALLFLAGPLLRWIATANITFLSIGKVALPGAVLFAGAVFAYSELAPFLLVALVGSGFFLTFRFHAWRKILMYGGALLGLTSLLLNTELVRAYAALRSQSGAVVGSPVDWSLLGFMAHAFGLHGGAWDGYQWSAYESPGSFAFIFGLILLSLVVGLVLAEIRPIGRATLNGPLMPAVAIVAIFFIGFIYFRYFVPSPFPNGLGQSWSQFKLTEWAHPFLMVLVLFAIASLRVKIGKLFDSTVFALFIICAVSAMLTSVARVTPLMYYYSGVRDLNRFYLNFRDAVVATCSPTTPIYLALGGENSKFRQMAILYLYDREVKSDWMDDGYIYHHLPEERRTQAMTADSCVVERNRSDGWLMNHGTQIGPFTVGVFDGSGRVEIASLTGAYGRESDVQNWWHWVERKVDFKLQPLFVKKEATQTKLYFEYQTRGSQTLTLSIVKRDGSIKNILLPSNGDVPSVFNQVIDIPSIDFSEFYIETNGTALPLSDNDTRLAAWIIRNVAITPVVP